MLMLLVKINIPVPQDTVSTVINYKCITCINCVSVLATFICVPLCQSSPQPQSSSNLDLRN